MTVLVIYWNCVQCINFECKLTKHLADSPISLVADPIAIASCVTGFWKTDSAVTFDINHLFLHSRLQLASSGSLISD